MSDTESTNPRSGISVHVDLDQLMVDSYEGAGRNLAEIVLDNAAELVARRAVLGTRHEATDDDAYRSARDRIAAQVDKVTADEIRSVLRPLIIEVIDAQAQLTNSWGEPTGKVTTLRERIMETAKAELSRTAQDSYQGRRRGETMAQELIRVAVTDVMRKELAAVIKDERAKVIASVRENAAEIIAKSVQDALR